MARRHEPAAIVREGAMRDVAFYVAPDGTCQVDDYFREPDRERAAARFAKLIEKLAEFGSISNDQHFRHEEDEIWGFKLPHQERVACFLDGRAWVCTHAFRKNGKWKRSDFDRAHAIRKDYEERKEGE